jgi:hypothetical protein
MTHENLSPQARFEKEMDSKLTALHDECVLLINRLQNVVKSIQEDKSLAKFNPLGIIQEKGLHIDRLCGEIHMLRFIHDVMNNEKPMVIDDDDLRENFDEIPF